jgi:hypothetical protein
LLGVLQLFLQVNRFLLHLAHHDLLDALDLSRIRDLGLQLRLMGYGSLCVRVRRLPQQTCLSLRPFSKRLHNKQKGH